MALDWPNTPTTGSVYTPAGSNVSWMWDGTKWTNVSGLVAPSGRNFLHNPYFNIQQRGTGPWTTGGAYTADRWMASFVNDTVTATIVALADTDRAAIGDEAALSTVQLVFVGSSTAGSYTEFMQRIESIRRLSNKQITASFWARATSGTPKIGLGYFQSFGTGGSPSASVFGNLGVTPALSTTWQHYSFTGTLPSTAGKTFGTTVGTDNMQLEFWLSDQGIGAPRSGGIGVQSGTVQFWGMQLELGTAATPLEKLDPETDLAHCQRFYQTGAYSTNGYVQSGTTIGNNVPFLVTMRATPSVAVAGTPGSGNVTGISINNVNPQSAQFYATGSAAGNAFIALTFTASADL